MKSGGCVGQVEKFLSLCLDMAPCPVSACKARMGPYSKANIRYKVLRGHRRPREAGVEIGIRQHIRIECKELSVPGNISGMRMRVSLE